MALYEVLEDGTIVPKAGKTVGNLDCLRTEVVYDMSSSDANKNWGYTSGIQAGVTVSGKDFSKYNLIKVYVNYANTVQQIGVIDMNFLVDNQYLIAMRSGTQANNSANFYFCNCSINSSKNSFTHSMNGYIAGTTVNQRPDNKDYVVYKIEGVLKTPAMIYTGKELFAGNGISFENGVISSNSTVVKICDASGSNASKALSDSLSNYKLVGIYARWNNAQRFGTVMPVELFKTTAVSNTLTIANDTVYLNCYYSNDTTITVQNSYGNIYNFYVYGIK